MWQNAILTKVEIILIKLPHDFGINSYLHWFDDKTQKKICSYYHHNDQLIAFTSQLLQQFYLAKLLKINKDQLSMGYTKYYKPFIATPKAMSRELTFNIAHSQKYVVMAVYNGDDYQIGVDIEQIDYNLETAEMSPIVFSPIEQQLIGKSKDNFFKLWTKKEALIKALGTGFATDFYQDTNLNLEDREINDNFVIITQQLENYFLSICLHKVVT